MLVLATYRDGVYNLFLFLHIVAIIVAFAPAVIHPLMGNQLKSDPNARSVFMRYAYDNGRRIYGIAIVLVGLFGMGMVGMSDKAIEFSDGWVSISFIIWIVMVGVLHGVLLPAEKKLADGDESMEARVQQTGMALTALLLIMLYLMIWKPGA